MTSIYSLNPITTFIFIFLFDFLTLLVVAIKLKSVKTLFKNPGFFLGDFIVLPLAASFVSNFYQNFSTLPRELFSIEFNLINLFLAIIISVAFGIHFKIIKNYWLPFYWWPHGFFHIVYVYIVSVFVMVAYKYGHFMELAIVLFLVGLHLLLGKVFNKIFEINR